jgi:hypothetical protein
LPLPPASDLNVTVHVNNVNIAGSLQNFQYVVKIFDPATPALTILPTSVFRDNFGALNLVKAGSTAVFPAGGSVASAPAAAQNALSDTFIAARDSSNGMWVNVFTAATNSWGSWAFAGGIVQGDPGIAVTLGGTAYIACRDASKSYWLRTYDPGVGFGSWTPLGGVFESDPTIAASLDGSLYVVGRDSSNAIWSGRFIPGAGFQGWQSGGAVAQGKPAVSVGMDGAAYIAIRDTWNSVWLGRVQGNTWTGWYPAGGVFNSDLQSVRVGNRSYVAGLDVTGALWSRPFQEGRTNGWQGNWTVHGGVLQRLGLSVTGREFYAFGADLANSVWSFRASTATWTGVGANASGGLAAAK